MKLPELKAIPSEVMELNVFNGINDNFYIPEGSFKKMENMSSDYYPAMGPRKNRDKYTVGGKINGVITVNGDVYMASGIGLYKNGEKIDGITLSNSQKEMMEYGAYIVIMPDKKMYNTQDGTVTEMSYTRTLTYGATLYLSDKNGTRIVVLSETAAHANAFLKNDTKIGDSMLNDFFAEADIPAYTKEISTYYHDGEAQFRKNLIVAFGSKPVVQAHSDNITYPLYLADIDSDNKVVMKKYDSSLSMWSAPSLYVTLWLDISDAETMEKNIKTGDYIKFETKNASGADIKKGEVKESWWKLLEFFNGYVKVENVLREGNQIGLVFDNTRIDFLQVLADTDGYLKYGNYTGTEDGGKVDLHRSVYSLVTSIGFPWLTGTSICKTMTIKKDMPDMDYMTVSNNRIWGCSNEKHEIYACKQGDATSWYCYGGLANDSYAVTIGSDGDFTGACTYRDEPFFFKEDMIMRMYGTKPSNYQISEIHYQGVESGSSKSICYLNGVLYYKARCGIVRFDGSSVSRISEELGNRIFKDAEGCAGDRKYFVSMKDEEGEISLYVYDAGKGLWHREDTLAPDSMFQKNGSVYAVKSGTKSTVYRIDGNGTLDVKGIVTEKLLEIPDYEMIGDVKLYNRGVSWSAETGPIGTGSIEHKYVQRLGMRFEMTERSEFAVSVLYDNETIWNRIYAHQGKKGEGAVNITFRPRRCEKFRLRFEGKGTCYIYSIRRTVNEGSDRHYGNI